MNPLKLPVLGEIQFHITQRVVRGIERLQTAFGRLEERGRKFSELVVFASKGSQLFARQGKSIPILNLVVRYIQHLKSRQSNALGGEDSPQFVIFRKIEFLKTRSWQDTQIKFLKFISREIQDGQTIH